VNIATSFYYPETCLFESFACRVLVPCLAVAFSSVTHPGCEHFIVAAMTHMIVRFVPAAIAPLSKSLLFLLSVDIVPLGLYLNRSPSLLQIGLNKLFSFPFYFP
jgi:hypothetical protein